MKARQRYGTVVLVAVLAFLPVLYRFFPSPSWTVLVGISLLITLVAAVLEHYRSVQPHLDLLEKRRFLYGYACNDALDGLLRHDPSVRLNVMEIDRGLLPRHGKFEIAYPLRMEGEPDEDLKLRLDQGVCGQAVGQRGFCVADLETPHGPTFNLDAEQRERTKHLTLILSMPIKRAKRGRGGSVMLMDEIIGVVNIDSKMKGAYGFYDKTIVFKAEEDEGQSLLEKQTDILRDISEVCSYIMS